MYENLEREAQRGFELRSLARTVMNARGHELLSDFVKKQVGPSRREARKRRASQQRQLRRLLSEMGSKLSGASVRHAHAA